MATLADVAGKVAEVQGFESAQAVAFAAFDTVQAAVEASTVADRTTYSTATATYQSALDAARALAGWPDLLDARNAAESATQASRQELMLLLLEFQNS